MDVGRQAEALTQKVRHYLMAFMGRWAKNASEREIFQALSYALREEIMVNWSATARTYENRKCRRLYYLSMEYLPGRLLANNLTNLHAQDLVQRVIVNLGKSPQRVLSLEPDPGLGNGGLGRLASCFLDSLATQRYPALGYGLRYQYGIFEQQIWEGEQVEKPDCWLLNENPWEYRRDSVAKTVKFSGVIEKKKNQHGEYVLGLTEYEEVRALPFDFPIIGYSEANDFNVVTLRLWSTKESPRNFHLQRYNAGQIGPAAENTALTDVLYPNDNHETGKRIRLKQEFLLVSASLQDILGRHLFQYPDMSNFADKVRIQINDTHPALVIAELMRVLTKEHHFTWKAAWEVVQQVVGYTNHTILSEALEQWNQERVFCLLPRQYWIIEQINHELCNYIRERYPGDEKRVQRLSIIEGGQVRMAHLAIYGAYKVNGVAKLHGEILRKEVFRDFYELFPDKFTYVTNGVTQRHWLAQCNPLLAGWITERIGKGWLTDFSQIANLKQFASDYASQETFLAIKRQNKEHFLHYLKEESVSNHSLEPQQFSPDSLFDVHIKRVHEYKRQLMNILHAIILYQELKENPESRAIKRTLIFSGKAAANYEIAKHLIHLIACLAKTVNPDPSIQGKLKILFVENYGVSWAEKIIPAAELSQQISTAGMEASGTGNMKLAMNGALTIGTQDGANIEMREAVGEAWWPFSFGAHAEELAACRRNNGYNAWDFYSSNSKIKHAVDTLKNGTFAKTEKDKVALAAIFDSLMLGFYGLPTDRYFVLKDLMDYYEAQKKVDMLYQNPYRWAETAIHNVAGMGLFSADRAINEYAEKIWGLEKCPVDADILGAVREEFSQHDRYKEWLY